MKRILALAILVFLICSAAIAQKESTRSFIGDSLDQYVEKALGDWQIPGAAVAVVRGSKIVYMKGYGVKEMDTKNSVDENTLFMIGSNTKAFTGTALAMLESEKKLSLEDKVQKWLPDFKLYDPWVTKEVNIADLLCHRLGFETFQGDFMYFDSDLTTAQVREKFGKVKPMYGFRNKWGYCNAAFMTAGEIIPKVTDKSWAEYISEKIFIPLGMSRSLALCKEIETATNKSAAHTVVMGELKKIPYGQLDNMAPAGSISSSASDMSKWVMALLNDGKLEDKVVIPSAAIKRTRQPESIMGDGGHMFNKAHFNLYGLGWFLEEYAGRKIVAHTGGVNGFVTSVCLVPEEKLGIIVLTNTDANGFYEALRNEIQDAMLGLPFRNYSNVYMSYHRSSEEKKEKEWSNANDTIAMKKPTALPLTAYAGEYNHNVYGKMNIKMEDGKLVMRFEHHKGIFGTLEALGGNRFFCIYSDPLYGRKKLEFAVQGGKVKSLTVRVADFVEFTPYEFMKIK